MNEKKKKRIRKQEQNFIYDYYYSENNQLDLILVYEKKGLFKKNYGSYEFLYKNGLLFQQLSRVESYGMTESIVYEYNSSRQLIKKVYYNGSGQLRYTVDFTYQDQQPVQMKVIRMGQFDFFNTENRELIQKMLNITGKDFEGSFFLLDLVESAGKS